MHSMENLKQNHPVITSQQCPFKPKQTFSTSPSVVSRRIYLSWLPYIGSSGIGGGMLNMPTLPKLISYPGQMKMKAHDVPEKPQSPELTNESWVLRSGLAGKEVLTFMGADAAGAAPCLWIHTVTALLHCWASLIWNQKILQKTPHKHSTATTSKSKVPTSS